MTDAPKASIPSAAETQFVLGLRAGLWAAISVTDQWDNYTRGRIGALIRHASQGGRRAETQGGSVHESAVGNADAPGGNHD